MIRIYGFITFFTLLVSAGFSIPAANAWVYNWDDRLDQYGNNAGYLATTPFPIDEDTVSYSINNDEGSKVFYTGAISFVDNSTIGCSNGDMDYDSGTRSCGPGSETVYTSIGQALSSVSSGNKTLLIRQSTYYETDMGIRTGVDPTHNYSLIGYKQERPIIDANRSDSSNIFDVAGGAADAYVTIQRLELLDTANEAIQVGGWISGNPGIERHVNFIDLYVHDICLVDNACNAGIILADADYSWLYHITVDRSKNHGYKISDDTSYSIVEWSVASSIGYFDDTAYCPAHCMPFDFVGHESAADEGLNNTLRYSIAEDTYSYSVNAEHQGGFVMHHNELINPFRVYDISSSPSSWVASKTDGPAFLILLETNSADVYSNVFRDYRGDISGDSNKHSAIKVASSTSRIAPGEINIFNNLFWDDVSTGLESVLYTTSTLTSGVEVTFFNNTVYVDTVGNPDSLIDDDWTGTTIMKNNILYQKGIGSIANGTFTSSDNRLYYPYGKIGFTTGPNDIVGEPDFVQVPSGSYDPLDGTLQSPDPGTDLSSHFTSDFLSRTRSVWDKGAKIFINDDISPAPPTLEVPR